MRFLPRLAAAATLVVALGGLGAAPAGAAPPAPDRLAVTVVGDGVTSGNQAVPVSIGLIDGEGRALGSIPLPTVVNGAQQPFTLGADRDQQGALQQSADHRFVTLGGYAAAPGAVALNDTRSANVKRVVAVVDAAGTADTSTTLGGAFDVRHIRGAVTSDGTRVWAAGHGGDATSDKGGVLTAAVGVTAPSVVSSGNGNLNNARVPVIHDDALYVSSDRSGYLGVNRVGTDLPTGVATQTLVAAAPAKADVPHDFAFVGDDLLYVTYTAGEAAGLAKYALIGGVWTHVGTLPGQFWGVTGRAAGDAVALYAVRGSAQGNEIVRVLDDEASVADADVIVIAQASAGTAYRGIAFAPGFTPGAAPVDGGTRGPTLAWAVRVSHGVGGALSAVLGDPANPTARGTITDPQGASFAVTATSADQSVVADADIGLQVAADGSFTVHPTPETSGQTVITLTVTTADERTSTSDLTYWVTHAPAGDGVRTYVGMSDASAAYEVGDGYVVVGDDDSNGIRLYAPAGGEPVAEWDFTEDFEPGDPGRPYDAWDLEAAARIGDVIYWTGSLGNTNSGNVRLGRDVVVATRVVGSGAATTLEFVGATHGVRQALVDWDAADGHGLGADFFGFTQATAPGTSARGPHSLNVEGAAIAPDDSTMWFGMRSPLITKDGREMAVLISVPDIADVVTGGTPVTIGEPVLIDLDGFAIRDMERTDDGNYLIIGGSPGDGQEFTLFGWTGDVADAPVRSSFDLHLDGWPGSWEAIVHADSLRSGTPVQLVMDAGTVDPNGVGASQDGLQAWELKKFVTQEHLLDFGGVFDERSLTLPGGTALRHGQTFAFSASGFAPREQVVLSLRSAADGPQRAAVAPGTELGSFTADGTGAIAGSASVPATAATGAQTLVASGSRAEVSIAVTVAARSTPDPSEEPSGEPSNGPSEKPTTGPSTGPKPSTDPSGEPAPGASSTAPVPVVSTSARPTATASGSAGQGLPTTGVDMLGSMTLLGLALATVTTGIIVARRRSTSDI